MAAQAEQAFVKIFTNTLSSQPITYPADYQQRPENELRKIPLLPIPVPPPPARNSLTGPTASSSASASQLSITFKSLKPPAQYSIAVLPTDSIAFIKTQLAAQPTAPPADAQRLLLKGKALADSKLLQEYSVKNGDTVNLVVKPGVVWDPSAPSSSSSPAQSQMASSDLGSVPKPLSLSSPAPTTPASGKRGHQRIPSVVLSPSPSSDSPGAVEKDIVLTLDSSTIPGPVPTETLSTYGATVSQPEFWKKLYDFLKSEFTNESDVLTAFEDFFRASKGSLTVSQIAKIRDEVGIVGMAGI